MKKLIVSTLLIGSSILAPATSAAAEGEADRRAREAVSYADLDLATSSGVASLDQRIEIAIRRLCGPSLALSLTARFQHRLCRREAGRYVQPQRALAIRDARRPGGIAVTIFVR
jgi:UrcA family protein